MVAESTERGDREAVPSYADRAEQRGPASEGHRRVRCRCLTCSDWRLSSGIAPQPMRAYGTVITLLPVAEQGTTGTRRA